MNIFVYLVYKTSLPSFIEYSKYVRRTCISPLGAWQFNILFSRRQRAVKSRVSSICEFFKAASFLVQHAQGFASMLLFPSQANPCYPPDEPTGGTQKWTMSGVNCLCILKKYGGLFLQIVMHAWWNYMILQGVALFFHPLLIWHRIVNTVSLSQ